MPSKRNIRIGNVSGATGDNWTAMSRMVAGGAVDVITGDWLSEMNIAWNAIAKAADPDLGYEAGFLTQLESCVDDVAAKGLKVITNAGALNTEALKKKVQEMCVERGQEGLVVASVVGDDISHLLKGKGREEIKKQFRHLDHWNVHLGIVAALNAGADIIICGRVTDASAVIGAATWWYGWKEDSFDQLAGALIAGHLIECGPYATGANFSGFRGYLPQLVDLPFGIAEILPNGECFITKPEGTSGTVNKYNITAQLLYELQGELSLNPDVVADISKVSIENTLEMMKTQLKYMFKDSNFSKLLIELYGAPASDPKSQQEGTCFLRVFVQARNLADVSATKFKDIVYALRMQSYPGYHMNLNFRTMDPKPFMEIFPSIIPLFVINHQAVIGSKVTDIPPPTTTAQYCIVRLSYETSNVMPPSCFGGSRRAPLGSIVHARSGDKANNSNIGFFVRRADEYTWLQNFLTVDRLKDLFGDDWKRGDSGRRVERVEFPNILAVHFRVLDFLDGGIASSSRVDGLGKGIGEFLRSRVVDVPVKFLERGWI